MQKKKVIILVGLGVILGGLIIFACTHKYQDSHLRIEGVRVKLEENSLVVEDCDYKNVAYCEKKVKLEDEEQTLAFEYLKFKENGYPAAIKASINGKEFYYADGLNIETRGTMDLRVFYNFYVMDNKYIMFTITEGSGEHATTLYAIDKTGKIILEEKEIDEDNMLIDDYSQNYVSYDKNTVKVHASRITNGTNYNGESICEAKPKTVVEAYYIYTYKDGKFSKKQGEVITAKEYIEDNNITCNA